MDELLVYLQNEPVILGLFAAVVVTVASFFLLSVFFRPIQVITPKERQKDKSKKGESNSKYKFGLTKRKAVQTALAILIGLAMVGASYLAYDFFVQPVRIVGAAQFKLEKGESIHQLQTKGASSWQQAKIYLLDVRSRTEYAKDHLVGSESLPAERAINEAYPIEGVAVAVYSDKSGLDEARKVADAIIKNGESGKVKYKEEIGKIFVIKDGFEGLKNSGLKTEVGGWD